MERLLVLAFLFVVIWDSAALWYFAVTIISALVSIAAILIDLLWIEDF